MPHYLVYQQSEASSPLWFILFLKTQALGERFKYENQLLNDTSYLSNRSMTRKMVSSGVESTIAQRSDVKLQSSFWQSLAIHQSIDEAKKTAVETFALPVNIYQMLQDSNCQHHPSAMLMMQ